LHALAGNLPSEPDAVPGCIAAAVQISPKVEKMRLSTHWADGLRARVTSGARIFKPDRCVEIHLNSSLLA